MRNHKTHSSDLLNWQILGWGILCIRFVQGWIFWGGGSRRFIYDPQKLDPYAPQWMANKLQSTMPGMLFDVGHLVSFLLQHFILLYIAIIVFSAVELLSGLGLIFGFFTRAAAMVTVLISVVLMILFGWQGATCLDEWTMAVSNLSMGLTLFLTGGSVYSLDSWMTQRYPGLLHKRWFLLLGSGPWTLRTIQRAALGCFIFTVLFTVGTYDYYRGSVFSPYHAGPVNPDVFHLSLSDGQLDAKGSVRFKMYVDGGPSVVPIYIMRIELLDTAQNIVESWAASQLRTLPQTAIHNVYAYNQVKVGMYGLVAPESAKAEIYLPVSAENKLLSGSYQLQIYTVDGHRWDLALRL
ncbi:TQO small subunit DoxD [Legionella maioricensis]|uniref:DoxX family membrane protein n=1 Tax=Legionella maioricensis TaxID=2896528 RepID=A0A9X2D1W0_9GAMM|nr:TQO small subunit DoxD [Legionella maioricensis]MCL9684883.1 DoxX family membrane protein [Legionella maioricensis]MCL9688959.1 DoxX family membrane protein [Legionella maioricensis]